MNNFITTEDFEYFSENGLIVDATAGGLVLGRSHGEGNIYMIRKCSMGYEMFANMELTLTS